MPDIKLRDNGPNVGDITLADLVAGVGQKRILSEQSFDTSVLSGRVVRRDGAPDPVPVVFNDIARQVLEFPPDPQILAGRIVRRNGIPNPPAVVDNFNGIARRTRESPPYPQILSGRVIRREGVSNNIYQLSISDTFVMSDTPTRTIVSRGNTIFYGTNN